MSQSTLSNDLEANDIDFDKKKFADSGRDLIYSIQAIGNLASFKFCPAKKQRTSKPAKLNETFSNAEQVKSQKYEWI